MPKYENYSPNIPNTDYTQEPNLADENVNESAPQPQPRRRRSRNVRTNEADIQESNVKKQKTKATEKPQSSESWFADIKNILLSPSVRIVTGILLGGLGFWLAVAFISYFTSCVQDQSIVMNSPGGEGSGVANDAGEGGARITELLINQGFGVAYVVIVVWLICMSLKLLLGYPRFRTLDFTLKSLVAFITISVVAGMLTIGFDSDVNWGGLHGRYINERIYSYIGWTGAFILSVVLICIFVVICLRDVVKWILKKKHEYDEKRRLIREAEEAKLRKEQELKDMQLRDQKDEALSGDGIYEKAEVRNGNTESVEFDAASDTIFDIPEELDESESYERTDMDIISSDDDIIEIENDDTPNVTSSDEKSDDVDDTPNVTSSDGKSDDVDDTPNDTSSDEKSDDVDDSNEPEAPASTDVMTVNINQIEKGSGNPNLEYDSNLFTHVYKYPPTSILKPGSDRISVDAEEQMENKEKIKKTLLDFGISIVSIEATVGPTVTLYEIRPDTGVKIAKIRNLVDDIALSLAAIGVRIIAPIPGKGTVGIEVANKDPQTVSMRNIIQSKAYQFRAFGDKAFKLPIALGSTISNEVYIADLAKMPHLLVAGATGQGKSVGLNAIVTSLLYSKRPEELKFVMVDPKQVEFSLYSKIEKYYLAMIPNSEQPIITNMENVVATLSSLCEEMEERFLLLKKAFVRQVSEYNDKYKEKKLDLREGHRFLPYIVVIIDEFADLIMTAGKEVEVPIARLAQKARAVGIHVIIATQRPSTNVITGIIKANFPVRIAFKVSSGVDSKTILDSTGAQQLIGRGDMLISNNGEMTRVQCAFVDTPEVEDVCDYVSRQPYPQGAYILPEPKIGATDTDSEDFDAASFGKKDPLLDEIARQVVMSGNASTSAVQRRYNIGYNRAGRIMDQMQAMGIVSAATGGKPRDVLVDAVTLESILESV